MRAKSSYSWLVVWLVVCCGPDEEFLDCGAVRYETCDIRDSVCQSRVFDQMRCLRGNEDFEGRPVVSVVPVDDVRDAFLEEARDFELTADDEAALVGLALIGMVDPNDISTDAQVDIQLDGLLGFYSHQTKQIVVLDHGVPLDDDLAVTTLGHEYVHALQDAEFGLSDYLADRATTFDRNLAARSVIEGEAVLYDGFQLAALHDADPFIQDWPGIYSELTDFADADSAEQRSPLLAASSIFPYSYGPHTAALAWDSDGPRGIERGRSRDLSTQGYLARRHSANATVPSEEVLMALEVTEVADRRALGADSFGAWAIHTTLAHALGEPPEPDIALGWTGDIASLFVNDDGSSELIWKVRFSTTGRAQRFADLLNTSVPPTVGVRAAHADGALVTVVGSTNEDANLEALIEASGDPGIVPQQDTSDAGASPVAARRSLSALLSRFAKSCVR